MACCEPLSGRLDRLTATERRRCKAMIDADIAVLEDILDGDMLYTHSTSVRDTKTQFLDKITGGRLDYRKVATTMDSVLWRGSTAIVVGEMQLELVVEGEFRVLQSTTLSVWSEHAGQWRLCGLQSTGRPQ